MPKPIHLTADDHALVSAAVGKAEAQSDGEIVTIVTDLSDSYHDVGLHWALGVLFFFLASLPLFPGFWMDLPTRLTGGWDHDWRAAEYLSMLLVASIILFLAMRYLFAWMPLRLVVTPQATKTRRVRRRAVMLFKVGAERRTVGLTGILIYISLGEHRAEIVADEAIAAKVAPEVWGAAMAALIDEIKADRPAAGLVAAVEQVGVVLAEHFPKSGGNPNELPDRLIEL